jgi:Fe2+ transport system protein FeoA
MFGARQRLRGHHRGACPCGQECPGLSLLTAATGTPVRVLRIHCRHDCGLRLRELGIVEGAVVELIKRADPVLLYAKDTRIGLDPRTAAQIEVEYASDSQAA